MIDLAVLGVLKEQELHGYELRKQVAELLGGRGAVSFGSLYPALARLERAGMVKAVEANVDTGRPAPSSGSLAGELAAFRARRGLTTRGGRSRKVYGITERGESHLLALLTDPSPCDDRTFALRVAFCRYLAPEERLALFERRRSELATQTESRRRRDTRLDHYLRALREHDAASLQADLAWLDGLIAAERAHLEQERT
jgi:DNA-binding PadR family transcriptional regulator